MAAPALEATPSASSASSATGTDWLADLGLASNSANVVVAGFRMEEGGEGKERETVTVTGSGSLALLLLLLLLLCLEFDWQNCFTLSLVANYATCETVPAPLVPSLCPSLSSLLCSPSAVNLCLKVDIMNLKVVLRWQRSATVAQRGV